MLRVPIVILILIGLWGCNVLVMDRLRFQYNNVLSVKSISVSNILITAILGVVLYILIMTLFTSFFGCTVETSMIYFYSIVGTIAVLPSIGGLDTRIHFFRLTKLILFPGNSISFSEILLADAFTSLSKVFKDIGITLVAVWANVSSSNLLEIHDYGMILVAILASLPYW